VRRLVERMTSTRPAVPEQHAMLAPENGDGRAAGIEIDGVVYPLDGQPPVATSSGWGAIPR